MGMMDFLQRNLHKLEIDKVETYDINNQTTDNSDHGYSWFYDKVNDVSDSFPGSLNIYQQGYEVLQLFGFGPIGAIWKNDLRQMFEYRGVKLNVTNITNVVKQGQLAIWLRDKQNDYQFKLVIE